MRRDAGTAVRAALAVALVTALVAGCSGGSQPQAATLSPTPSPTVSPVSPSASPTLTAEAQVEAAVRTYYAELTKAAQTQDTKIIKTLVDRGCPCFGSVREIDKLRKAKEFTPDALWTVQSVRVHDVEERLALAEVKFSILPYSLFDNQGRKIDSFPRHSGHLDLSMVQTSGRWVVAYFFDFDS